MTRIQEREEKTDRYRLYPRFLDATDDLFGCLGRQGQHHTAVVVHPLRRPETELPLHQGAWLVLEQVVQGGAGLASDLQDVLKAAGGDQRRPGATSLQQCVGGHRGAVDYGRLVEGVQLSEAVDDRSRRVIGRGEGLVGGEVALLQKQEVGEGAAHIYAHDMSVQSSPFALVLQGRRFCPTL